MQLFVSYGPPKPISKQANLWNEQQDLRFELQTRASCHLIPYIQFILLGVFLHLAGYQ